MTRKTVNVPMNRVEGDLEIRVEIDQGVVVDSWSSGTLFRGFENLLKGRGSLDGLVLTPRICGLCSSAHLLAAARALDSVAEVRVPGHGLRVRNVALMAEHIQSDLRQAFLMFAVDFTNPAHADHPLYEEAVRRYRPLAGDTAAETIRETKHILEILGILGGQWPHSSFMVPGGVVSVPTGVELQRCRMILGRYREHYERRVLGSTIERFAELRSRADLDAWLEESPEQRDSEVGFFLRFGRHAGLDRIGRGHGTFLSYGGLELPEDSSVKGNGSRTLMPAGFARLGDVRPFEQEKVAEHVAHSWFMDYEGGRHPHEGETRPYATGDEGHKYSWAKAPRYDGQPAETGPLAIRIIAGDPLFLDLVGKDGPSALVRQLARLVRPATLIPAMEAWLDELAKMPGSFCLPDVKVDSGRGQGLTEATRGALGHWVEIEDSRITRYQVITPTAWNGSPRDSAGVRGPWEEALLGTPVADLENPVALGHVVRSFDPCQVCTVHSLRRDGRKATLRVGI